MVIKNIFILILSFFSLVLMAQSSPLKDDPYFFEYGGYDSQGEEKTYYFLTKTGYNALIVPTGNDTLVNYLLSIESNYNQILADNKALKVELETLKNTVSSIDTTPIKTLESEVEYLKKLSPSYTTLYNRYYKTSSNKNDFSMKEIDVFLGGDGSGTKKKMALRILEKIQIL